jgi:carbonic anhydrase/acetyltransferase-like protein (isoleucine patch superfamily)
MSRPSSPGEALLIPYAGRSPLVDPQGQVAPTAVLVGEVTISATASVGYGAILRADLAAVTVGEAARLGDNVIVHTAVGCPAVIGPAVSIGPGAVIHGCTIEAGCSIGANATVLNGAVIGRGSIVTAGTVVLERTRVPPRSLVAGIPGRVGPPASAQQQAGAKQGD